MKHLFAIMIMLSMLTPAMAQSKNYVSLALYNTQTAMPFGKFAGLFGETFHPCIEAGMGKNFSSRQNHDWFTELKLGYFFHRFVQHAIPVSVNIGYRYKFNSRFFAQTSIGGGYLHSIPATSKLKTDENGDYTNDKGLGRIQASVVYDITAGYELKRKTGRSLRLFLSYQQRLQMPFVRSYVPLLPYNSFGIGISKPIR